MTTPTPTTTSRTTAEQLRKVRKALAAVPDTPSPKDDDDPRDWGTIAFRAFVSLLLLVLVGIVYLAWQGSSARDDRTRLLDLIDTECGPGGSFVGRPICVATAPERAADAERAATDSGLDAAQVIELVRAELAANPPAGGRPTAADVDAAVRKVLGENPELYRGAQGPGPTTEQIQAAAAAVMAADPEAFRGQDGVDGAPPARITIQYSDGSSSACTRDDGSPATAPTYTCPPPSGGVIEPGPTPTDPGPADPAPEPTPEPSEPAPPAEEQPADPGGELFGG